MPKQKATPPAVRRFTFEHDPILADDEALSYIEQKAAAEQKAGRMLVRGRDRVTTERIRILVLDTETPGLHRQRTERVLLRRTFIFR